jgi:nucleoside-diphosphate-sugar epimerase
MKTLVTGVGGFIGSHLASELIKRGHTVRGLFFPGENTSELDRMGIEPVFGDLTKIESIRHIADGIDIVFHLATRTLDWGTQKQFESIMVGGTENLLTVSAGKISRFIYFSSIAAMGLNRDLQGITENASRVYCGIPYCDTKIKAEDLVADFCPNHGMEYVIIRPANVTGPKSVWVTEIIKMLYRGAFPLISGGKAPSAFVYIDNLVNGSILAAESGISSGRVYFFMDDYDLTWKEYIIRLGQMIGKKPFGSIPFPIAWTMGSICETLFTPLGIRPPMSRLAAAVMGRNNAVDCTRAKQELGWKTIVSKEEAFEQIEKWVKEVFVPSFQAPK